MSHVWLLASEPRTVFASSAGAERWASAQIRAPGGSIYVRLAFGDALHGWVVGAGGQIRATSDGGASWHLQRSGTTEQLTAIGASDADHAWATGMRGSIVATADGGATWRLQRGPGGLTLHTSVACADAQHVWIARSDPRSGVVLVTRDGGARWSVAHRFALPAGHELTSVASPDAEHCWIVAGIDPMATGYDHGRNRILATADGGAHWGVQYLGGTHEPVVLAATDSRHVWAAGYAGMATGVLASSDGGTTWKAQPVPASADGPASGVAFSDVRHGWVLVGLNSLLTTADGGATWTQVKLPPGVGVVQPLWDVVARDSEE